MTPRAVQSEYMHWAKNQSRARYALSSSEVPGFRMDSLPVGIADLELDGASYHRYPPLREAIARQYGVAADNVVTADGTSMANMLALAALIAPGEEVLFERPTYEPMLATASFAGGTLKRFDRVAEDGFRLDPDRVSAAITDRTRLIALTNLHNPSGALAQEDELRAIGKLAERVGARVLIDEVYLDASVPKQRTAALFGAQFIVTSSLTKVYGLSGLRCGWILAEPALAERIWRLNELFAVAQAHPAERLSCIAFDYLDKIVGDTPAMLERNRALFNTFVAGRHDIDCMPAKNGITAFPRWANGDTERLDALLRSKYDTSIVPGRWFELPDHFRIGVGAPTEHLQEGLVRLGAALDDLQ
jgi:aspartate/methionine/tyrosine aminotransferase